MRTVDYIAKFLISKKIREIFMLTGYGSLNLKKIAEAFDMKWTKISDFKKIDGTLKRLNKTKGPIFVEVITNNQQKIVDSFGYFT